MVSLKQYVGKGVVLIHFKGPFLYATAGQGKFGPLCVGPNGQPGADPQVGQPLMAPFLLAEVIEAADGFRLRYQDPGSTYQLEVEIGDLASIAFITVPVSVEQKRVVLSGLS